MANNPRKFSEKIALLNQKEQEGNAEFEKIMREVSNATSKIPQQPTTHNTNLIAMSPSAFLSRSLPNVNAPINKNLDNNNEEAAAASALAGLLTTPGYSNDINKSTNERSGSVGPQDNKDLIKFPATNARESRGRSVGGGPMRSRSRNIDTSPYSSNNNAYLSPPTDSSWRRTSSDSAIHQSLTQAQDMHNNVSSLMLSPRAQKRLSASQSNSMKNLHQQHLHHHHTNNNSGHQTPTQLNQQHSHSQQNMTMLNQHSLMQQTLNQQHLQMNNLQQDMKSRSVSRLPGISIYPSGNDDTLQIPIGNSTGSLPDLTLVHFQSPLSTPLDLEHDHQLTVTSSFNTDTSYSMSMASTNQTTNQLTNMGIYNNLDYSPKHYGTKASSSQGIQSENNSYNQQQQTAPITIDQQQRHHQQQQQHQQHSPNHQSYPINQMNEKLMSYRNTASPTNLSSSQGNLSKNSYRSTHNRPSPGSSPGVPGLTTNFDSNSSAPCSPSPQMTGINGQTFDTFPSVDSFYINPNSIQQHFEQFSLDWTSLVQSLVDSGCTISAEVKVDSPLPDYITSTTNENYSQMTENNFNGMMDDVTTANRNQQQHLPTNRSNNNNSRTNSNNNNNNNNNSNSNNNNNNNNSNNNNGHNNNNNSQNSPNNQNHCPNNANINSNNNINNNQHHQHHQQQHSPMNNDSLIGNNGYNSFNAALEAALHENGVNDILLGGGMGSDSNSKLITSSSAALQTSISMMTSHPSPQHLISTQTTTSIPEIIFSDYSSGSTDFARDIFCNEFELGSTELQMFENANIIADPTIEDSFRRDLY